MQQLNSTEEQLRAEIEDLRRKVAEQDRMLRHAPGGHGRTRRRASTGVVLLLAVLAAGATAAAFFLGYLPHARRQADLVERANGDNATDLTVVVTKIGRSPGTTELTLQGNIQPVTEAPIMARATGYLKQRYADIGDKVKEGQLLAEIDAPELTQQLKQAEASLEQANAMVEQATANLQQGRANEQMARTTADRYRNLVTRGAVSRQEADNFQSQYDAQHAGILALEKAVSAAKSNQSAVASNVVRLKEIDGYRKVYAPFAGVVTVRNVDSGALVNEGNTLLYRVAQTGRVRTYINVPQAYAGSIHAGMKATVSIPDLPNHKFEGVVTHTSDSLDAASRTLLVEVQLDNKAAMMLPGMYTHVTFSTVRQEPPPIIPGDALVIRADGPQVALLTGDKHVHFQKVVLGRDFGDSVEALSGVKVDDEVVANPNDRVIEGVKVNPVMMKEPAGRGRGR